MRARDFLTRAGALVAGRWLHDGLKALLLLWLARANQPGWGLFVLGLGLAMMIRSLLALGLDQFTMRELARKPDFQGPILAQMFKLKLVAGALILAGMVLVGLLWGWGADQMAVVVIVAAAQVLEALCDTVFNIYRLKGLQVKEAAYTALAHSLGVAYGALALSLGWGIAWVACFVLLGSSLRLLLALVRGMRKRRLPPPEGPAGGLAGQEPAHIAELCGH